MKKFISIFFATICYFTVSAQLPGKMYTPGDTIKLYGLNCLVIATDESGLHGKAMSPHFMSPKEIEKAKKSIEKELCKQKKKGQITEEEFEIALNSNEFLDIMSTLPELRSEKVKGGIHFYIDEFNQNLPQGWRFPTEEDATDFATVTFGGFGKDYKSNNSFGNTKVADLFWQAEPFVCMHINGGILFGAEGNVKVIREYKGGLPLKYWLQVEEKVNLREQIVMVCDF